MFGDYLLVSARRMIQVMSGVTDPRVQQMQVKNSMEMFLLIGGEGIQNLFPTHL